jgi:hypothetical protein
MIAQKFLHDAIYTAATWDELVCDQRPDLTKNLLEATERLILFHIDWRVQLIAEAEIDSIEYKGETFDTLFSKAIEEASDADERYSKFLPNIYSPPDDGYYSDDNCGCEY